MDNAIKYGQQKEIIVTLKQAKGSVIIEVKDQGIGIDENQAEHIFQDRYRIPHLHTDGYGIGLSLVHHVCELCHGFVTFDSTSKGTTFYLCFPIAD